MRASGATTKVWVSWEVAGAENVVVDVAYRTGRTGQGFGEWVHPDAWKGLSGQGQYLAARTGDHVCFALSARDASGNRSAWVKPRCTYVDGTAPVLTSLSLPDAVAPDGFSIGTTTASWTVRDDRSVTSYDVWRRTYAAVPQYGATPTRYALGWDDPIVTTVRSARTSVEQLMGQTGCIKVRARDAAGNVGPWSGQHCTSTVMDGQWFAYYAPAWFSLRTLQNNWAEVAPGTSLRSTHGAMGRSVRFRVSSGPSAGSFDVYSGSTKIGHVNAYSSAAGTKTVTVRASAPFRGYLTLRSTSSRGTVEIRSWAVMP
ncbi:hypothetical protein [Sediminihabitans luteus]|uniref:hypothetical protein n=1 Tax=Sediminihabitans luteus TaxID=1138585 RepID=UPI000C24D8E6|nr:hypothetical protein [Sediminihabitans luteus]